MPRHIALKLINLLWYSTATLIVCAAILVAAGREMLPRVNLANENLLRYINQRTGAQIQATELRCQWTSLYPEISAKQLLIDTSDAHVQLDNARITINLFQSLLQRTPVVDHMQLARADIRYMLPENSGDTPPDIEKDWRFINRLFNNDVQIGNIAINLQRGDWNRSLELDDLRVEQGYAGKKFFLKLIDTRNTQSLSMTGNFTGNSLRHSEGLLYVKTDNLTLEEWVPVLAQKGQISGEAWVRWDGLQQTDVIAKLRLLSSPDNTSAIKLPAAINGTLGGHWEKGGTSHIDLHSLDADEKPGDKTPPVSLFAGTRISFNNTEPGKWRVQLPALHLDDTAKIVQQLPEGEIRKLFESLNLHGYLRNINLVWDNNKPLAERMYLQANADNISSGAWEGVPAFTGVSGYIQSGIGYGFIDLDSRDGFSMHYPEIYHEPIAFQRAAGRVQWQWLPEQETVLVGSDYASLSGEPGEARGSFWLHLPLHDADFHSEMYLAIGLRNSKARYRDMFLPYILPHDLLAWLKSSIGDADLPDAGFLYRGALSGNETQNSAVQFYTTINGGELQFDPAWPPLKNINAHLLVDDTSTIVQASSAQMYNTAVNGAHVEVLQQHPGLVINVNGRARGTAEDGLRLLRESPLRKAVGNGMDNWHMPQGSLDTALQLQIPLSGAAIAQTENVQLHLADAQLDMNDLRLRFSNVGSDISYDTDNGLTAPVIEASLFNKPVRASIASVKTARDSTINVTASGSVDIRDITQWSMIKPLALLSGSLDYNAALKLGPFSDKPAAQLGQLQISSNLEQIAAPLPEPFNKKRGTAAPFKLTVNLLRDNRQQYQLDYNKQVSGVLAVRNGVLTGGDVALAGSNAAPSAGGQNSGLLIHGTLPQADIQQWIDLIGRYNALAGSSEGNTLFPAVDINISRAVWKNLSLPDLTLSAAHNDDAWQLSFNAGTAQGKALFHDSGKTPDIIIDTLKINRDKAPAADKNIRDTIGNIDFAAIPSLDIRIDHLFVDGMDVGNISTELRSTPDTLRFEKLMATGNGYLLRDGSGTSGSTLLWHKKSDGSYSSEFHGLLRMSGAQPALEQMGVDMFIIGKSVSLFADVTWPGAPQEASVRTIAGSVYTEGKDGKYLQAKPNTAMRALGIINITTWVRRLQLDFSDLRNDGISFDEYKGKLLFGKGMMQFTEPLQVKSPSSAFRLSGKALLDSETLDLNLVATLPVGNNATWIAAIAGGLPAAAGVYVASKVFDKQINSLSSLSYKISGPMGDPDIRFDRIAPPDENTKPTKWNDVTKWF